MRVRAPKSVVPATIRPDGGHRRRENAVRGFRQRRVARRAESRKTPNRWSSRRRGCQAGSDPIAGSIVRRRPPSSSPPGCTNACGCGCPPAVRRSQRCSTAVMRARGNRRLRREMIRQTQGERLDVSRSDPAARTRTRCSSSCRSRDTSCCRRRCRPARTRLRAERRASGRRARADLQRAGPSPGGCGICRSDSSVMPSDTPDRHQDPRYVE